MVLKIKIVSQLKQNVIFICKTIYIFQKSKDLQLEAGPEAVSRVERRLAANRYLRQGPEQGPRTHERQREPHVRRDPK